MAKTPLPEIQILRQQKCPWNPLYTKEMLDPNRKYFFSTMNEREYSHEGNILVISAQQRPTANCRIEPRPQHRHGVFNQLLFANSLSNNPLYVNGTAPGSDDSINVNDGPAPAAVIPSNKQSVTQLRRCVHSRSSCVSPPTNESRTIQLLQRFQQITDRTRSHPPASPMPK